MRVGEVAKRTGLTIRALHHYDEIGLLKPSAETSAGHRLYTEKDLARLQQIASLRHLGFALDEIAAILARPHASLPSIVELHLEAMKDQLARTRSLIDRLEVMAAQLRAGRPPSLDQLLAGIKETTMDDQKKHFTPEQIEQVKARAAAGLIPTAEAWKSLAAEVRAEYDRGTLATAPAVMALARRWQGLVDAITGQDEGISESLAAMHRADPDVTSRFFGPVIDRAVLAYLRRALTADKA